MEYVIGIDIGTSGLKSIIVSGDGEVVKSDKVKYDTIHEKTGYSEMNPEDWYEAAAGSLGRLLDSEYGSKVTGISFSGQMHGLVIVDKDGEVIRPAILWNDTRTSEECKEIIADIGLDNLLGHVQNTVLEGFTLSKLIWVKKNEPENYKKIDKFMMPKDYVIYRLTGNVFAEPSDAAGTVMFDVKKGEWSETLLEQLGLDKNICPEVIPSHGKSGILNKELFDIEQDISIYQGGADNACGALGAGITDSSRQLVSIGTSGVVLSSEEEDDYMNDGSVHYFNHCVSGQNYVMGVTLSAGYSLEWLKKMLGDDQTFGEFMEEAKTSPLGAKGLLYTPFLLGERTPYNDAEIRGSFIGLDANTNANDMKRAVIEGITFSLNESIEIMRKNGKNISSIVSIGGGAGNRQWLQMQADIFDAEILTRTEEQGPAYGAAMIAAIGEQWFEDFSVITEKWIDYKETFTPITENKVQYKKLFELYREVYEKTQGLTGKLLEFK
ncbi:Xylulose kinase [Jeotgalicoccus aerolatus]|uniref:Xylulose kinase n=1 Tax=Jeotgalicoccus aerolatus TaxID=709510 RepID=A0A1G8ZS12_9STAP|nr:xylulokinase [Jeotgalicoccus aerolatus]MBP1951207.1 xylulokinase [Jeotgalicoccus aerolatus]NMA80686.1 xylulokinase [Jeotgalicoccus aerolatus]CAD2077632.1 Xylulose kinase [Jeotgalicoccus aerolatus]SDK17125.1 xylulokinase [Jeotgalicoccus aerolatus]GGD99355.1 xylulose kinase [Jeotgalicoccus aerolatus]